MANRFTYPRETALDSNGDPLGGAKLYFYESSTTKAADTFSDEGLGVANANPVVADSAGRFGDIWLKAQDYKVVLADADDVTIWTVDPVHGTLDVSGDDFKTGPQSPADMTVLVAPGSLYDVVLKALVARAAQTSALIAAPSSNPRKDIIHIDRLTGVIGIDTGTEAASPVDPAIGDGKLPVARVTLATTTTEITDSEITDIRELGQLGAIGAEHIQNQTFSYATAVGGSADVVTAVFAPVLTAFTEGMRLALKVGTTNTGAVTLNPDGLGAIEVKKGDGTVDLAAGDWTAGQIVEVEYDGANFQMVSNVASTSVDVQTFTSSGTWTKPSGATRSLVQLWGGGGSGGRGTATAAGGGGGGFAMTYFAIGDLGATETVTIGSGGASKTSTGTGTDGGNSTFGSLLTGYGGGGGGGSVSADGGGGGGLFSAGINGGSAATGGDPLGGVPGDPGGASTFGGAGGGDAAAGGDGGVSVWGGAGGGTSDAAGGKSFYGGGGGGGEDDGGGGAGGVSTIGGNGGAGGTGGGDPGTAGTQPGGGGGGSDDANSGAGGDGQCVVISW